jgi:hypothetical protein
MCVAELIVSRLDRVRQVAPDRWRADCPAGHKSTGALSIIDAGEGRIKIHCFAGCDAPDILAIIGLSLSDLYPTPPKNHDGKTKQTKPGHWHMANVALRILRHEVLLVVVAAENVRQGVVLDADDLERLAQAAGRIRAAAEAVA